MRSLQRTIAFALLTFALVPASVARADVPSPPAATPSPADAATAKKHFESGLKLFGEQAYAEAAIAFEASYKLGGRPSALKNFAQCQRNLKHFVEAHEAYDQLLALHGAQLAPPEKKAVEQALEELGLLTAPLTIKVDQPGATIEIDGKPFGTSPLAKPKRVSIAEHRLRITKTGFDPFEKTFEARSGKDENIEVQLAVERRAGHVVIREQSGREVHIIVDGTDKGPAPWEGDLPEGEHTVEAKGARFAAEKRTVQVARGGRVDVAMEAAPLTGHLRITAAPASATIAVDNAVVGTGVWEGDVAPGPHRIDATLAGTPPAFREIVVERGQTLVQEIQLVSLTGAAPPDYRGVYATLALHPLFPLGGAPVNEVPGQSRSEDSIHFGAGGSLHIGYSLDWLSFEAVGIAFVEHKDEKIVDLVAQTGGGAPTYRYQWTNAGFVFGLGPRVTSKDSSVRFTFGLAPGLAIRRFAVDRKPDGGNDGSSNCNGSDPCNGGGGQTDESLRAAGYTGFALAFDGGMLFGHTPGAKFYLGVQGWLDVPPNDIVVGPDRSTVPLARGRGYVAADSLQFFIGPALGLRLGH